MALSNYPGRNLKVNYEEDILVGYRWYYTKNITPLYPFGYGLSYTTFEIKNANTNKIIHKHNEEITLNIEVKNIGKSDGAEVIQLYTSQTKSTVVRPKKELKTFEKIFLKSGETKKVELKLKSNDLAFYDEKTANWKLESGEYELHIGNSSRNIETSIKIQIE